jgi:nucleoside-diphosphate-sugar epimerase
LFIGGTGVISTSVSELTAEDEGMELYLLNRGNSNCRAPKNAVLLNGDVRDRNGIAETLRKYDFDVVVNWIVYTPDQLFNDIELFRGRIGQYIFISSASAYSKPPTDYLVTESTALSNPYWQYSRDKISCEELLVEHKNDFPATVVRPNYTYDKTMLPYIFNSRKYRYTLIDRMRRGKKIIVPGDGTSIFTITHSRDFAKGFKGLIGNMKAIGQAFHITSDEARCWDQVADMIGAAAGAVPDKIHIPSDLISFISPEHTGGLLGDKSHSAVYDNEKIKAFVPGYRATIPLCEGLKEVVSWYDNDPDLCRIDLEFNELCDTLVSQMLKAYGQ